MFEKYFPLILLLLNFDGFYAIQCHSCLTYCKTIDGKVDPVNCDCQSPSNEQCSAEACFAKIEIFSDEKTAIVQKGCISDFPAGQRGCQYASNTDAIHCFCDQNECNTRHKLNMYIPTRLPSVECCSCSSMNGDDCDAGCTNKCRGNYCIVDFDGNEQGCGLGYPRLPSFLRTDDYLHYQGGYLCTRYESSLSHVINGCVCTDPSGTCNDMNKTKLYRQKQVIDRRKDSQHYCYSLVHKAHRPFGQEVFSKSSTCEGHFCFISLTTSEIVLESAEYKHNYEDHEDFIGVSRPRYELQVGCIKVDDDEKVNVGCTVETQGNNSEILTKHCICDSHLCNFYHLAKGSHDPRPKAKSAEVKMIATHSKPVRLYTTTLEERSSTILVSRISTLNPFNLIISFSLFITYFYFL
ncbi:unnamed protein product [Caenorhabditis angaria]|uniref:UPAR/Ly6 domain-containing protein n=1 Tax=Caenorhabditis angaria TaxID=860376 RepID=A0A9P1NB27_9PELO|nr:unnamed protein product [Caenorhabditis angaria]